MRMYICYSICIYILFIYTFYLYIYIYINILHDIEYILYYKIDKCRLIYKYNNAIIEDNYLIITFKSNFCCKVYI